MFISWVLFRNKKILFRVLKVDISPKIRQKNLTRFYGCSWITWHNFWDFPTPYLPSVLPLCPYPNALLCPRAVLPNHCAPRITSAPHFKGLPEKFEIHNMLCFKMKFDSTYEGFSDNFIVGCSATFKKFGKHSLP